MLILDFWDVVSYWYVAVPRKSPANRTLTHQIYEAVGEAIARTRRTQSPRLTQADVADRTGGLVSRSAIANIERGRQRVAIHHLYAIGEALNCRPEDLLPPIDRIFPRIDLPLEDDVRDPVAMEWLKRVLRQRDSSGPSSDRQAPQ